MSHAHPDSEHSLAALYLNRIGFTGPCEPTLDNLRKLLLQHVTHIPFGNVASLLGADVPLGLQQLAQKLLIKGREGYCFEHSLLVCQVLRELGYNTLNRLGRVYFMAQANEAPTQSHLVTLVNIDGEQYLYDPNFGGLSPSAPLALARVGQAQETPHESYRFIPVNESGLPTEILTGVKYMLQAHVAGEWINLYAFDPDQPVAPSDVEVANWYIATSPDSLFTQHLLMAIATTDARVNLLDNTVKIHNRAGTTQQVLKTAEDFKQFFEETLNISPGQVDYKALAKKIKNIVNPS